PQVDLPDDAGNPLDRPRDLVQTAGDHRGSPRVDLPARGRADVVGCALPAAWGIRLPADRFHAGRAPRGLLDLQGHPGQVAAGLLRVIADRGHTSISPGKAGGGGAGVGLSARGKRGHRTATTTDAARPSKMPSSRCTAGVRLPNSARGATTSIGNTSPI